MAGGARDGGKGRRDGKESGRGGGGRVGGARGGSWSGRGGGSRLGGGGYDMLYSLSFCSLLVKMRQGVNRQKKTRIVCRNESKKLLIIGWIL
jgi:hypothetical protein